jgi:hypothetical protein
VQIHVDPQAIADFCRGQHIRKLALFGSVLRDDFRLESDGDVLVEFEAGESLGWNIVARVDELALVRRVPGKRPRHDP